MAIFKAPNGKETIEFLKKPNVTGLIGLDGPCRAVLGTAHHAKWASMTIFPMLGTIHRANTGRLRLSHIGPFGTSHLAISSIGFALRFWQHEEDKRCEMSIHVLFGMREFIQILVRINLFYVKFMQICTFRMGPVWLKTEPNTSRP